MSRVIGVVSGKGGVGKTTVVVNVGAALAHRFKKRVAVVDCNVTTSHLGVSLGFSYLSKTLNHVLRGESTIHQAIYDHHSGMKVIPSSMKLKDLKGIDFARLKPAIRDLEKSFDIVLLDAGPGLGREGVGALLASQELLFVSQPTLPAIMDIVRCQEAVKGTDKPHLGIVLNLVENHGHHLTKENVENLSSLEVVSVIPRDDRVPESLAAQTPVVLSHPQSPAGQELLALAARIIGEPVQRVPTPSEHVRSRFKGALSSINRAIGID
ncbi:AAA family ATPase [Candidatus Micrarchaeota archaeon]|nr:AAA family ATPase [Candidatus Micrarchaeota archaeon]